MGILGVQVVFSLIAFSFLQKLSRYYSFGLWLLSGRLVRYVHPTNDQLRSLAKINNNKRGRRGDQRPPAESFTIPRNIALELDTAPVHDIELVTLKFYPDYQWLMDYSACALCVYVSTELAFHFRLVHGEYNLSVMWCLLATGFCLRVLLAQLAIYMRTEEGGERILCFAFALFFLVVAMAILLVDSEYLEFGLEEGYANFSESARIFMLQNGYLNHGPVSINTFKIILAVVCATLGTFLTFPGLRFAKMYLDSLKYSKEMPLKQTMLHLNFVLPVLYILMWVKPISRDMLCAGHEAWQRDPLMRDRTFESLRIGLGLAICLLRLSLLVTHVQSHLNLAHERIQHMRRESGRITSREVQKMVARVSYYLCVVTLQYVSPALLLLFTVLLLKTLGAYSWLHMFSLDAPPSVFSGQPSPVPSPSNGTNSVFDAAVEVTETLGNLRSLFTATWYRGVLAFMSWWINAAWFITSLFGVAYYGKMAA